MPLAGCHFRPSDQVRSPQEHSYIRMVLPVVELSMVRTMAGTPPQRSQLRIGSASGCCGGVAEPRSSSLTRHPPAAQNHKRKSVHKFRPVGKKRQRPRPPC
jgi:hypothetical protein